ncbi:hypothetical protein EYF80_038818 [Liparis tanakae]|uniref:Uncharacterized protein n=1 Tax=Liparis tanakae TaxID=230148 RepID=A0A4Z2GBR1_9TELE|nr:hypothetical protein EYF80_038818 [Liparis tanakae]
MEEKRNNTYSKRDDVNGSSTVSIESIFIRFTANHGLQWSSSTVHIQVPSPPLNKSSIHIQVPSPPLNKSSIHIQSQQQQLATPPA